MDWHLLDYAKEAEETAAGLQAILGEIPQYRKDVTGHIAELFAISSAIHELHEALSLPRYGKLSGRILKDLDVCLPSLGYTLDDVRDMHTKKSKRVTPGAFPGTPPYASKWEELLSELKGQGISLPNRLQLFRTYLQCMYDALRGDHDEVEIRTLRARIGKLLQKQEPVNSYFGRLSLHSQGYGHAKTPKPPSPKHARPNIHSYPTYPISYPHHPAPPIAHPATRPPYPPTWGGIGDIPFVPPPVPEIPQSPTYSSASSHAYSNHSNDSSEPAAHWAMKIFDGRHPSTVCRTLAQPTLCDGRDEPRVIEMLQGDGFEKVLELPFEANDVTVRLYWRAEDNRARILFLTMDPSGHRYRFCFPLTGLTIIRDGSSLKLCRVNRKDGKLDLWARLRFTIYERMTLLYCTLVAMKHQDTFGVAPGFKDVFDPPNDDFLFSGEITDGSYRHTLKVCEDEDSGCLRLQATPRRGPLADVPIWTAFINEYSGHRSWLKRVGKSVVQFQGLHPYVFCDGYKLPKGPSGKYQITFTLPDDAKAFLDLFRPSHTRY